VRGSVKFLVLCGLASILSCAARADDIHVVLDPEPPQAGTFDLIQQTGVPYQVTWGSCTQAGVPTALQGETACLLFINQLPNNQTIEDLTVSFVVPAAMNGQTISCTNTDAFLTSNSCSAAGTLSTGEFVTFDFDGGTPIPNESAFFLGEDGVALSDLGSSWSVQVPEPSTLLLLLVGLGSLLAFGFRRQRALQTC
jgi:hypothetical protein